ncbi:GNAT family N-acetyltransferase [Persicitalea sp.]|uniref:GNAT family N-acetyltransferase n=1 Tax=Persicitalea sp. TaxID=3100273 RepID=UPI0035937FCF
MKNTYFLEGDIIYLREVRLSDVNENYYAWLNDSSVNQYLETRFFPRSLENTEQYVKSMDGNSNEIFFAICTKADDKHIGNIKLGPINWIHQYADIGLLIGDKDYWGKGLATEAIRLATKFGFSTLNLHKLKAGCYADNVGSKKAFLKAGFIVEGTLRQQFFSNGAYQDAYQFGILRDEFNAQ